MKKISKYCLILIAFVWLDACKTSTTETAPKTNTYLVSATQIADVTKEIVADKLGLGVILLGSSPKYNLKAYKIVYKTKNSDGSSIQASGVLLIPQTSEAMPLVSSQHGTITDDAEAPSNFKATSEAANLGAIFASYGYMVACPDYIGYGTSVNLPHTYEHRESLANASLDMLRASKEYIEANKLNWNKKTFLTGYSEGGFATLSLQKMLEEKYPTEFNLIASSCGSGAYNKTGFVKFLTTQKTSKIPSANSLYLWVLLTYDRIYGINRPMNAYFKEPYATEIQNKKQNANISVSFDEIFTDSFKKGLTDGTDTAILNALKDNDVFDWKPNTPTYLYHGDADDLVYYFNSKDAYDAMQKRGAGEKVKFLTALGKTHSTAIQDYLIGTFQTFSTLK